MGAFRLGKNTKLSSLLAYPPPPRIHQCSRRRSRGGRADVFNNWCVRSLDVEAAVRIAIADLWRDRPDFKYDFGNPPDDSIHV